MEAPRWRLTTAHYLRIPELPDGTKVEWEHKETARESGRTVRKLHPVPMLLDPRDAADHNYPGEIIVAHQVEGAHTLRNDIVFLGDPTPEMEPLNEAAEAITAQCRPRWENPIDSLPANGGMTGAESAFMAQMMEAFAKVAPSQPVAVPQDQLAEMRQHIAALEAALAGKADAPARRV